MFPRVTVGGKSLLRMIIGTNWIAGWSHRSPAADRMIKETHAMPDSIIPVLTEYQKHGVDTIMAPFGVTPVIVQAIREAEQQTGKGFIMIDTPIINVADNPEARKEANETILQCKKNGSTFCFPHHVSVEKLIDKNAEEIRRISDYTNMIRDAGLIPGFSAHMPEVILYSDMRGYDAEAYIQIYNCLGFLMQIEVETIASIIHGSKKPIMAIKPMAAGRCTPYVGLNFAWATLRPCDMVVTGAYRADEVAENVEISTAHFEKRFPNLEKRASPAPKQSLLQ